MNLKQLSHMLSLSQTTVSRALNGYPEVNEETRRRVIDAAKRHGYRPNPSARRLATGKAGMIGYVMPTGDSVDIDPHFVEFLSGPRRLCPRARARPGASRRPPPTTRKPPTAASSPTSRSTPSTSPRRGRPTGALRCSSSSASPTSCMAAARAWTSTIPSSTSTMKAPSTRRRGCWSSSATAGVALINGDDRQTFAIHRERGVRRALAASGLALPREPCLPRSP